MLLLLLHSQASAPQSEVIDLQSAVLDMLPMLGASNATDLIFWGTDELYTWFDEAVKRLSRTTGVFAVRDTSLVSVQGQGTYTLPVNQVATVQADLGGFVLRPANVQELEALDDSWPSTVGAPLRFVQDTPPGVHSIVLYPAPDADSAGVQIGLVLHVWPTTITPYNPFLLAPTVLREYFVFSALGKARVKETRAAMPEVGQWFGAVAGLYEQSIRNYWGGAM